jgi:hypothetical protein
MSLSLAGFYEREINCPYLGTDLSWGGPRGDANTATCASSSFEVNVLQASVRTDRRATVGGNLEEMLVYRMQVASGGRRYECERSFGQLKELVLKV